MHMTIETPIGVLSLFEQDEHLVKISWRAACGSAPTPLLKEASRQIEAYFSCGRTEFDLPLKPAVSAFEQQVLDAMLRIPFGQTRTYGELARELQTQPQAIGQACGANPIPLVIPCHRILAANGLGGYSGDGGVETKVSLLRHEGAYGLLI